jgi:hypothetical protein
MVGDGEELGSRLAAKMDADESSNKTDWAFRPHLKAMPDVEVTGLLRVHCERDPYHLVLTEVLCRILERLPKG